MQLVEKSFPLFICMGIKKGVRYSPTHFRSPVGAACRVSGVANSDIHRVISSGYSTCDQYSPSCLLNGIRKALSAGRILVAAFRSMLKDSTTSSGYEMEVLTYNVDGISTFSVKANTGG